MTGSAASGAGEAVAMTDPRPPAAAFADLVAVMDRLRSPGGCPWDAEQTHASLAPYAVEEAHEVAEAAESGDLAALREELGDLLLQVVFQARVAQEHETDPFDVDDVIEGLVTKLHRRHPHVFAGAGASAGVRTAGDVEVAWQRIKATEKPRAGVIDGVPVSMPALARAQKYVRRLRRAGWDDERILRAGHAEAAESAGHAGDRAERTGRDLLALVLRAESDGADAEAALRAQLRRLAEAATDVPADRPIITSEEPSTDR